MKAILMSIQPKWCELIASGEKTIEVRKTAPKLETPFKVYVYQTKHKGKSIVSEALSTVYGGGKVIGSFVCDKVYKIVPDGEYYSNGYDIDDDMLSETCLGRGYLTGYGLGYTIYGWHITEPKLFDKPRGLVEFRKPCEYAREPYACYPDNCELCPWNILTRLPQSWQYVEELQ